MIYSNSSEDGAFITTRRLPANYIMMIVYKGCHHDIIQSFDLLDHKRLDRGSPGKVMTSNPYWLIILDTLFSRNRTKSFLDKYLDVIWLPMRCLKPSTGIDINVHCNHYVIYAKLTNVYWPSHLIVSQIWLFLFSIDQCMKYSQFKLSAIVENFLSICRIVSVPE